jgi:uncharacterized protein YukE
MSGPIRQNFAEVASLTQQHTALASALKGVFDDLIKRVTGTKEEGWQTAAAAVFMEKQGVWDKAAQEWADSQGNLARVIGQHNEDVEQTDRGPASNVFSNIAI